MKKNVASQRVGAQMVTAADGTAFTGSVTVAVTGDAGTQATGSVGAGACTHEGNGYHTYAPAQAETNYDLVAFTFTGTGAVPQTVQIYTTPATGLLAPTTAGRTLDVTAGGCAGVDWANVEAPTTTLGLTGTTIASTQQVDVNTIKTQTVTCGAGVTVLASVGTAATSTAQTGDAYAIVNSGTHGNAALLARTPSATSITNMNTVFATDFATNYNTTNDGWVVKLGDYAHGGTGAGVTFSNFTVDDAMTYNGGISVAGAVTLSQSVTATNASNDIRGVVPTTASKTGYALASNGLASVTAWTVAITGNVTGNVSGTVGGIAGTLTTLDELDTAQDSQHTATQALIPDIYHADISLCIDEANTQDEYTVTWFKNGVRQTSGITSPTIQVVKRADGTDLIASTAMTQIGSTGSYKYDATTTARTTAGEAVLVVVGATIDASGRTFSRVLTRDSTA